MGWSIPTILFPLVKSPAGFALARFAVGFAEGPFFACVALMTSSWYVREELPFRMALWHGAQCMSYVRISHETRATVQILTCSNVLGGPFAAVVLETM